MLVWKSNLSTEKVFSKFLLAVELNHAKEALIEREIITTRERINNIKFLGLEKSNINNLPYQ